MYQTLYDDKYFMILIVFWQHKIANMYTIMQLNYTTIFFIKFKYSSSSDIERKTKSKDTL